MATAPTPLVLVAASAEAPRAQLGQWLRAGGYRVADAQDGDGVLARLVAEPAPDVVLLAHASPALDATAVLERLRELGTAEGVPMIVLDGEGDGELLVEALRLGAHDFLRTPLDPAELTARVLAAARVKARYDALVEANARLSHQALTDDLTGLANRRHGVHELERAVAAATRHGHRLAVARIDVDSFKAVNDTHGHACGDRVLAELARRLSSALRGADELARWGGDEFVALLPDTDDAGAGRAAARLHAAVRAAPLEIDELRLALTVSVGWAAWRGETPAELLARADRALYQAKAGRDTVCPPVPDGD